MKKAVIFINGDLAQLKRAPEYLSSQDFIICADGGAITAIQLGVFPQVVIGDLDSLPKKTRIDLKRKKVKLITYPEEKDQTDAELALDYAKANGYKKILIFGLLGTRIDHLLGNIFLLAQPKYKGMTIKIFDGTQELFLIEKKKIIKGKKGDYLSLIPLCGNVAGLTSDGLKFKLTNDTLYFSTSRGISNVLTKNTVTISLKKGKLLAIHQKK